MTDDNGLRILRRKIIREFLAEELAKKKTQLAPLEGRKLLSLNFSFRPSITPWTGIMILDYEAALRQAGSLDGPANGKRSLGMSLFAASKKSRPPIIIAALRRQSAF